MIQAQLSPAFVIELWCLWHPDTMSLKRAPHLTCLHSLHMCLCLCIVLLTLERNNSFFCFLDDGINISSTLPQHPWCIWPYNSTSAVVISRVACLHNWTFAVITLGFSFSIRPCLDCPNIELLLLGAFLPLCPVNIAETAKPLPIPCGYSRFEASRPLFYCNFYKSPFSSMLLCYH